MWPKQIFIWKFSLTIQMTLSKIIWILTPYAPTPQTGQTYSNNSSVTAAELFKCVWPFYGVGAQRVNSMRNKSKLLIPFTCSKLIIKTLGQGVKYVQS